MDRAMAVISYLLDQGGIISRDWFLFKLNYKYNI